MPAVERRAKLALFLRKGHFMRTSLALSIPLITMLASGTAVLTQTRGAAPRQPEQRVTPPEARYWMGVTTNSGMMGMAGGLGGGRGGSMADMMRAMSAAESHLVELRLGSTLAPTGGGPEAFHTMPPGAQANKPIFLQTPEPGRPGTPGTQGSYQQPKGQITFYWGCGEKAGPGQPVVLTFDKLVRGENDPELQTLQGAVNARAVNKPTQANSKTYGDWPNSDRQNKNRDLRAQFLTGSTIAGPHSIQGTYTPKIDFTLADNKSYMPAVQYTSSSVVASGALALAWNSVDRATGYSIGVMAPEKMGDDSANIIMWSSAERPATFIQMEELSPAEVTRLIGLKAVLPASTTSCAIPAEVVKATKEGSMLMFTAFGDEATFIHPARPADPAVTWDQEWFARVSYKSARMDMLSPQGVMDMGAMMSGRGGPRNQPPASAATPEPSAPTASAAPASAQSDEEYCKNLEAERAKQGGGGGGITGGLGGRLGRRIGRAVAPPPDDPRCPKK
jgi:hypothetical protein